MCKVHFIVLGGGMAGYVPKEVIGGELRMFRLAVGGWRLAGDGG